VGWNFEPTEKKKHAPKPKVKSPKTAAVKAPGKKNQTSPAKPKKWLSKAEKVGKDPTNNQRHHDLRL
jgi:hypothetical protein